MKESGSTSEQSLNKSQIYKYIFEPEERFEQSKDE